MSEIKTACPVCNQHITLDSAWIGQEVGCPACQSRFTVPAPAPPSIRAAAPPPLPVSPPILPKPPEAQPPARKSSNLIWIVVAGGTLLILLLLGLAVAGLFAVRKIKVQEQRQAQMLPLPQVRHPGSSLGLRSASLTNVNLEGSICGEPVQLTTGNMTAHAITLSEGTAADRREILLFLFLNGASPEGRSWTLPGQGNQQQPNPHVHFRCPASAGGSGILGSGYQMELVFEKQVNGRIPARLELNEPGKGISLRGSFELVNDRPL